MLSKQQLLLSQLALMSLSALTLSASFIYEDLFFLPWVCFVPFLMALEGVSIKRAYCLGLVFGCVFFAIASYWVVGFLKQISSISFSYAALLASSYWVYCAQQFALLAAVIVWFSKRQAKSEWLSLSLFSTLLFYTLPMIFPADLSVTQGKFLLALQAIDTTGALGLHFIILLHNGLIYGLIKNSHHQLDSYQYTAFGMVFVWFLYGFSAYYYWSAKGEAWTSINVGVVQPNLAPSIKIPDPLQGYSRAYSPEIELSLLLARDGASLIVWPEARYRGFFDEAYVRDAFKYYAEKTNTSFLIQDLQTKAEKTYNSSALISNNDWQEYSKYLRIPFGEYLPLEEVPIIGSFVKNIFGDFYTPIALGSESEPMNFRGIKVQPLICFEVANAYYVANLIQAANQQNKSIQIIAVQSNDSWFDTDIEPRLHLTTSQLRSIEQRLPLVHALNNGPSAFYKASGQVEAQLPANERSAAVVNLAYPEYATLTLFARFPYAFILLIGVFSFGWVLVSLIRDANGNEGL
jgi:apolipoprotein N-acyltransferase